MEESKEKVQARLREALNERPGATTDELQAVALEVDPSLASLSRRQFNAGYVLAVKRGRGTTAAAKPARTTRRRVTRRGRRKAAAGPAAPAARARRAAAAEHGRPAPGGERERVREILMRFARDLTRAESRADVIELLGSLDSYADDVLKAVK